MLMCIFDVELCHRFFLVPSVYLIREAGQRAGNDVSALALTIASSAADSKRRSQVGMRGREIVEAEFSQGRVVAETFAVYRELLES
jgi:glycosyltransferase involved in cell wall biosynthesis